MKECFAILTFVLCIASALGGENWYVTLGGKIRERFELLDQPGFGTGPEDKNGYFLQRYLLSSDFHPGSRVRVFTELQSGLENGRDGGPRPTDLDRLDLHTAAPVYSDPSGLLGPTNLIDLTPVAEAAARERFADPGIVIVLA